MSEQESKPITTVIKARVSKARGKKMKKALADTKNMARLRSSHENEVKLSSPSEFFKKIDSPIESKLYNWTKQVQERAEEQLDLTHASKIVEVDNSTGKWRWRKVSTTKELKEILSRSDKAFNQYMITKEAAINKALRESDDFFGGDFSGSGSGGVEVRPEYTPLIGTPFYKQMYLFDYWEMHSKCFWYSNYSGIGKMIVDMTRNFVMGNGWNVSFGANPKDDLIKGYDPGVYNDVWMKHCELSNLQEESRNWCDDLTKFGELMLKKIPGPTGLIHRSFDPSTVWEIVTDPENIHDIKYYHQQYNTQYQMYTAPGAPISKYIINQLPPQMVMHEKINITSFEKRGRSDLLAPLLYFKYYEDYMQSSLIRSKNEASFMWDVSIDGSDEDVNAYISGTESITNVPPGSEFVHNKSITRTALSPSFGARGQDETCNNILSYIAMAVSIPTTYFGTFQHGGGGTKAGSLVATEPVAKKMIERQKKMEALITKIVKEVLIYNKMNPNVPFEVNFPEIMEEDRTKKIQDIIIANQEGVISQRQKSHMIAKELKITNYDYETTQDEIADDLKTMSPFAMPGTPPNGIGNVPDLTNKMQPDDTGPGRALDRSDVKDKGMKF